MPRRIGVLGDPRSGKSVLTYLVYRELGRRGRRVLRQEGDPASPTPPWYLEGVNDTLRLKLKRPWSVELAEWVRKSLERLKENKYLEFVVVDLPGGRPPKERVTPELAMILSEVDEVVLLCRDDNYEECVDGWLRELKEKNVNVGIIAYCRSKYHGKKGKVTLFECEIPRLERKEARNPFTETRRAVEKLTDVIEMGPRQRIFARCLENIRRNYERVARAVGREPDLVYGSGARLICTPKDAKRVDLNVILSSEKNDKTLIRSPSGDTLVVLSLIHI